MKKRFLSLFIGLALVLSFSTAVPCFADEGSTTINYMIYQYDTSTGEAMVLYADKGYPSEMGIPETIDVGGTKYTVTSIGDNAFKSCKSLKSITIPGSVKSIGEYAFGWCTGLTDVTIPYSITSIGEGVFYDCYSLDNVTIPDGVESIGKYAFSSCTGLGSITIPDSVTSIGDNAFSSCTGLTDITIPDSVTSIGMVAFSSCTGLTDITIPYSVTSIEDKVFGWCDALTDVYVPTNLSLSSGAFYQTSQPINVWRYDVLKSAGVSGDGKTHVKIVALQDKGGNNNIITDRLVIQRDAMSDGYVIDEVEPDNLFLNHIHELATTDAKEPTCTEGGNKAYWYCETCDKYFSDKDGIDETSYPEGIIIQAKGHSYEAGRCTVCSAIDPDFEPIITDGANGEWTKGTKDGLSFTSNAAFADFQKVQVDSKDLDASNYTVKEGSTVVTLNASYLETLSVGKHTLSVVSETGTASTEFTIKAAASSGVDQSSQTGDGSNTEAASSDVDQSSETGDSSNMLLWMMLLFISGAVLSAVIWNRRQMNR